MSWELGAALTATIPASGGGTSAPGAMALVSADVGPRMPRLHPGLLASLSTSGERTLDLGSGRGVFSRSSLQVGPRLSARVSPRFGIEPRVLFEGSRFEAHGEGFPVTRSTSGTEVAVLGGVRSSLLIGAVKPWISLDLHRALTRSELAIPELGLVRAVHDWEVLAELGLSFSRTR